MIDKEAVAGGRVASQLHNVISAAVGLIAIAGLSSLFLIAYFEDLWRPTLLGERYQGAIIVSEPEVYTRERLVNDRFRQQRWLELQLEKMNDPDFLTRFSKPQTQILNSRAEGLGVSASREGQEGDDAKKPDLDAGGTIDALAERVSLALPPAEHFRELLAYRNEVNQELMLTQLDDRHDIGGNTLVRLDFDATVLPMRSASDIAMIRVTAQGRPILARPHGIYRTEIDRLYMDWMNFLQFQYDTSTRGTDYYMSSPNLLNNDKHAHQVNMISSFLDKYIYDRINQKMNVNPYSGILTRSVYSMRDRRLSDGCLKQTSFNINEEICSIQRHIFRELYLFVLGNYKRQLIISYYKQISGDLSKSDKQFSKLLLEEEMFEYGRTLVGQASIQCISDNNSQRVDGNSTSLENRSIMTFNGAIALNRKTEIQNQIPITKIVNAKLNCPNFNISDGVIDITAKFILLSIIDGYSKITYYDLLCAYLKYERRDDLCRGLIFSEKSPHFSISSHPVEKDLDISVPDFSREAGPPNRRYAAALYQLSKAQHSGDSIGSSVSKFYDPSLEGCDLGRCRLVLRPNTGRIDRRQHPPAIMLSNALERHARLFTYAVAPKQTHQVLETETAFDSNFNAKISGASAVVSPVEAGIIMRKAISERLNSLEADPIIVGFAEHNSIQRGNIDFIIQENKDPLRNRRYNEKNNNKQSNAIECIDSQYITDSKDDYRCRRVTTFGWIIRPSNFFSKAGDQKRIQKASHSTLSATLSVPSWWRGMIVTVRRCWISEEGLSQRSASSYPLSTAAELCSDNNHRTFDSQRFEVTLPGSMSEVSKKLGIEVLYEPYLKQTQQFLEIGRPGQIVIEGGRLWRSTVVTIGNFLRADSIEVMPNMMGIIAKFDCVLPSPMWSTRVGRIVDEKLRSDSPSGQVDATAGDRVENGSLEEAVVWTSEGRTESTPVTLLPFRTTLSSPTGVDARGELTELPCWIDRNRTISTK